MDEKAIVHDVRTGYLGWSNVRGGLEFFRGDGKNNRWEPRRPDSGYADTSPSSGLLLQDDIGKVPMLGEGCVCVVITMGTRDIAVAQRLADELAKAMERGDAAGQAPDPTETRA